MKILEKLFRRAQPQPVEPESKYATRCVGPVRADGTWTAELSKDGVPFAPHVEVGSISAVIAASKQIAV